MLVYLSSMVQSHPIDSMRAHLLLQAKASTLEHCSCLTKNLVRNSPIGTVNVCKSPLDLVLPLFYHSLTVIVLHSQAKNIMKHLETKREAAERRRVALMSKGIAEFLERTAKQNADVSSRGSNVESEAAMPAAADRVTNALTTGNHINDAVNDANASILNAKSSVLDQIRKTLDEAANILRESLELVVGGVVFLDPTVGYSETGHGEAYMDSSTDLGQYVQGQEVAETRREKLDEETSRAEHMSNIDDLHLASSAIRSSVDKHRPAKVQSMSASNIATWDPQSRVLDSKTLQTLINTYPLGNVWYIDDEGYFQSLEQMQ
jgi:hypothetical protein